MKHAPGRHMNAYAELRRVFGPEFDALTRVDSALIGRDYLDAVEDNCHADEYARRIGRGNLQSYAEVMRARARILK